MRNDNIIIKPKENPTVSQENPFSTVMKIKRDKPKLSAPKSGYFILSFKGVIGECDL